MCKICSELTINIPERHEWRRSGVFVVVVVFVVVAVFVVVVVVNFE